MNKGLCKVVYKYPYWTFAFSIGFSWLFNSYMIRLIIGKIGFTILL